MPSKDRHRNNANYKAWYQRNRSAIAAKKYAYRMANFEMHKAHSARAKAKRRQLIAQYKLDQGCAICGYKGHPDALDFDHLPGTDKKAAVSQMYRAAWTEVMKEIEKCQILCANCHRIISAQRIRDKQEAKRAEKQDKQLRLHLA